MSKPFDASLSTLIDECPADWAGYLAALTGVTPGPFSPVETDISRTVQADRAFRIDGPSPEVVHLEMQSSSRLNIPRDLLRYNSILHHSTGLPVQSVLMLLRRSARASDQTGLYEVRAARGTRRVHTFEYTVVPIWEQSVESFLAVPGLAPLALLTDEAAADLPEAFERFRLKLREPGVPDTVVPTLLTTSFTLYGLRHDAKTIRELYMSLSQVLEDSTTYQWIIQQGFVRGEAEGRMVGMAEGKAEGRMAGRAEGKAEEAVAILLRQGRKRFGEPSKAQADTLAGITDLARLESLTDRILDAVSWDDLLATP